MAQTKIIKVNIDDIGFSEEVLRTRKPENQKIIDLADSIESQGLLNLPSIAIDPMNKDKYVIIDGAGRLVAMKYIMKEDGRLEDIYPGGDMQLQLKPLETNMEILCAQIAGNANIVKTANSDYIKALFKVASEDDGMPAEELAKRAGISLAYMLKLFETLKLPEEIIADCAKNEIGVGKMITLSKLAGKIDENEIGTDWVDKAKSLNSGDFAIAVQDKLDLIQEEKKGIVRKFELTPKLLKREDLEIQYTQAKGAFEADSNLETETRFLVFQEIFQVDSVSAAEREQEYNDKEQKRKDDAEIRKAARVGKKIEDQINDVEASGYIVTKVEDAAETTTEEVVE